MAETTYSYIISVNFPNGFLSGNLHTEITSSTILTALSRIEVSGDICNIIFKNKLTAADKVILDGNMTNPSGGLIQMHDSTPQSEVSLNFNQEGNLKIVNEPMAGSEKYFYSPNLCDKTAWYESSSKLTEVALSDSGDQTTWNSGHQHWIDLSHGKVFKEDKLVAINAACIPVIEVSTDGGTSWSKKNENTWGSLDGDYNIDYDSGNVIFNSALSLTDVVRASFCKAGAYKFTVAPDPGKRLKLTYVEVQFTEDIVMQSAINFEIWAYNIYDLPNKFPVVSEKYKKIIDFYQESTGPFPVIPPHGGAERGLTSALITIPFNYLAYRDVKSSQGIEVRITLGNGSGDVPFLGTHANVTFYCLSEPE